MTDNLTSDDEQSLESTKITSISSDADLPTQVSEIIAFVEKQQGSINHIRKTMRLLRDRVTMPEGLPQGSSNPLSAKEQNEALSRYVDRTTFKNQMKQIAIKIDEIMKSQKVHATKELEDKVDEALKLYNQEKEKIDHIMTTDNQRIDVITEKMEANVSDTAKAITQLKNGVEDTKNKLKVAIKSSFDLSKKEINKLKDELVEFKKGQQEKEKKVNSSILELKEEIAKLKSGVAAPQASAETPTTEKSAPSSNVDLTHIISRLDQLELNINSKAEELSLRIEEIGQNVKNNEKTTEDLSSKMSDFDNQYSLDCEQRLEHDTEIDTELSKVKLSIEAAETEIKNQTEKITVDFEEKLIQQKAQINENNDKNIEAFTNDYDKKLDEQKKQLENLIKDPSTFDAVKKDLSQQLEEMKKQMESANIDQLKSDMDEHKKQIESLTNNVSSIDQLKSEITQQLEEQKKQIDSLSNDTSKIDSLKSEINQQLEELKAQIQSVNSNTANIDELKNQLNEEIEQLKKNCEKMVDDKISSYSEQQNSQITTIINNTTNFNDFKTEINQRFEEQKTQINTLTTNVTNINNVKAELAEKLENQQKQIEASSNEGEKVDKKLDDLKKELTELINNQATNMSQSVQATLESKIKENKTVIEDLTKEKTKNEMLNKIITGQINDIKNDIKATNTEVNNKFELITSQLNKGASKGEEASPNAVMMLQDQINELRSSQEKNKKTTDEALSEINTAVSQKVDLNQSEQIHGLFESQIHQLKEELNKQIDELKDKVNSSSEKQIDLDEYKKLKETVNQLKQYEQKHNEFDVKIQNTKEECEKQINQLRSIYESSVSDIKSIYQQSITELKTKTVQHVEEKMEHINEELNKIKELQAQPPVVERSINLPVQEDDPQIQEIRKQIEELKQSNEKNESAINDLTNKLSESKTANDDLITKNQSNLETIQTLKETITTIESKVVQIEKETNTIQSLTETINTINTKMEQVTQLNEKVLQIEKETNTIQSLTEKVNTMTEKIEHTSQLEEKLSTIENSVKEVQTREIKLEDSPDSSKITELEQNIQKLQEKVDSMNNTEEQLSTQLNELKEEFNKNVNSSAEIISETVSSFKTAYDGTSTEIQEIKDKVSDVVNKLSESTLNRIKTLEDNFSSVSEKSDKCTAELDELKGKMYTTFVTADALDTIKQKRKNLKENVKTMVTELNSYIENEKNERMKSIDDINAMIEGINQSLKESSEKSEMESKYNKEQIRKILKQINRVSKSKDAGEGEDQAPSASPELIMDVDELKFKLKNMEEINSKYKDDIVEINKSLQEFTTKMNEQKDDYSNRISNLEFVSNSEQKDIMDKILKLEDQLDAAKKSVDNLPGMVMEANQMNQASINEFSQHVEDTLTDMKSQLKQATFADDDITELTKKFSIFEESFNKTNLLFTNKIDKLESEIKQRREAEDEHSKMWAAINDVKVKIDVQIEKTNPQFSNLISKLKKSHKEIKEIVTKQNDNDESEAESEDNAPPPEYAAQIEMIKAKVQMLEEEIRKSSDAVTHIKEEISINKDTIDRTANQIRDEMVEMRNKLPESFIEIDSFNGLKEEVNVIHGALNTSIETTVSEREKVEEQLNNFNETLTSMQASVKSEVQSLLQHALKNSNISTKDIKLSDTEEDDDDKPKMPTAVIGAEDSSNNMNSNEVGDLKLMINGIDIALQRQIRKLKISVRNIERMLEDAAEEEKRQIEIEKQKKEKEELAKEIMEEENKKKQLEEKIEEEEEVADDDEVIQINQNVSQKSAQVLQQPGAVVIVDPDHNNLNSNSVSQNAVITTVRLPTVIELIQDDFNIFFVLMFSVLLYFLVSDLFLS